MRTMHILTVFTIIISVAAFSANYPESSDFSPHPDEGDLEILEPQSPPAVDLLYSLLARGVGFTTDVGDTDLSAAPGGPRDSRSPHHWYTKPHIMGHYYKPQHYGDSHYDTYQYYKPAHHYKPSHYYKPQDYHH